MFQSLTVTPVLKKHLLYYVSVILQTLSRIILVTNQYTFMSQIKHFSSSFRQVELDLNSSKPRTNGRKAEILSRCSKHHEESPKKSLSIAEGKRLRFIMVGFDHNILIILQNITKTKDQTQRKKIISDLIKVPTRIV